MNKYREFTRQELYERPWSTKVVKLAKYFDLSDVGLRNICVKHEILLRPLAIGEFSEAGREISLSSGFSGHQQPCARVRSQDRFPANREFCS